MTATRVLLSILLTAAPAVAASQQQQGVPTTPAEMATRARALVDGGRYAAATAIYAQLAARYPDDVDVALMLARTLAWAGRYDEAQLIYLSLAVGGSVEAEHGLARIAAWQRDYDESERAWRAILDKRPRDLDAWLGLADVLRWNGRLRKAREALQTATKLDPASHRIAAQLAALEAELAPRVEPVVSTLDDSDGNEVRTITVTGGMTSRWDAAFAIRGQHRSAEIGAVRAASSTVSLQAKLERSRYSLDGGLGVVHSSAAASANAASAMLAAHGMASTRLRRASLVARLGHEPFDDTAPLILRRMAFSSVGAGASMDVMRSVVASVEIAHGRLQGATPNARTSASSTIRWKPLRLLALQATASGFGYESNPREGYFAPRRYILAEGGSRLSIGEGLGWSLHLEGAGGVQSISAHDGRSATRPAARAEGGLAFRPHHNFQLKLSGFQSRAISAAATTLQGYSASGWTAATSVRF